MQLHEIEAWALRVIDNVIAGRPHEDSRTELKADWPADPAAAARRIAGHANAARGAPILWLIGVDERRGVVGVPAANLATWWPSVKSQFNGVPPTLVDLTVSHGTTTAVALYFETTRAPFVVRNSVQGAIQYEVPWREGTAVRSADRSELLRILSPLQQLPSVEVMSAELKVSRSSSSALAWGILMRLYVVPQGERRIVIPFHRCRAIVEIAGLERVVFEDIVISPPREPKQHEQRPLSLTIEATNNEGILNGPGKAMLQGRTESPSAVTHFAQPAVLTVELRTADADESVVVRQTVEWQSPVSGQAEGTGRWAWSIPRYRDLIARTAR